MRCKFCKIEVLELITTKDSDQGRGDGYFLHPKPLCEGLIKELGIPKDKLINLDYKIHLDDLIE